MLNTQKVKQTSVFDRVLMCYMSVTQSKMPVLAIACGVVFSLSILFFRPAILSFWMPPIPESYAAHYGYRTAASIHAVGVFV